MRPETTSAAMLLSGAFFLLPALPHIAGQQLVALIIATSFAAGLNIYATVGTLGLLGHYHVLTLPDGLQVLTGWWIIGISLALFIVEFFADKIPAFDLIWNAMHTFVRVPVAAILAYRATTQLSAPEQMMVTIAGGLIALAAHGGKTAARAAVTPSPEPVSNIALSMGEDVVAVGLTWFATQHPFLAAAIVLVSVVCIVLLIRAVIRSLRALFLGAERRLEKAASAGNT